MSNEKFTLGKWFCGVPFRHKGSASEWCNVYSEDESNHIAEVLLYDGEKNYYNAKLISAAPEMYHMLKVLLIGAKELLAPDTWKEMERILKKARGEE